MVSLKPGDRISTTDGRREFIIDSLIHTGTGQGDIYKVHTDKDVFALNKYVSVTDTRINKKVTYIFMLSTV